MATLLDEEKRPIVQGKLILGLVSEGIKFLPTTTADTEFVVRKAKRVVVEPSVEFCIASIAPRKDASDLPHFELNIEV